LAVPKNSLKWIQYESGTETQTAMYEWGRRYYQITIPKISTNLSKQINSIYRAGVFGGS
jgi:hypothetical protein